MILPRWSTYICRFLILLYINIFAVLFFVNLYEGGHMISEVIFVTAPFT